MMVLAFVSTVRAGTLSCAAEGDKPNVIFILADDLGIGNVGCYGSDHCKTPNIDKLASSGTRFTRAFTAALCGPSRAMIMSGRYAFRNGSTNQDACMRMDHSEIILPKVFKSAGYVCSAIGKWGQLPGLPSDHGFDAAFGSTRKTRTRFGYPGHRRWIGPSRQQKQKESKLVWHLKLSNGEGGSITAPVHRQSGRVPSV